MGDPRLPSFSLPVLSLFLLHLPPHELFTFKLRQIIGNVWFEKCAVFACFLFLFLFISFVTDNVTRDWWQFDSNHSTGLVIFWMSQDQALLEMIRFPKALTVPINRADTVLVTSNKSLFQLFSAGVFGLWTFVWAKWSQLTRWSLWGFVDLESTGFALIFLPCKETWKIHCRLTHTVVDNSQYWQ